MRDTKRIKTNVARARRRTLLLAIVLAAGPTLAETPKPEAKILPPLPLSTSGNRSTIRMNPFCLPDGDASVQLASGEPSTAVRLKPIGAAIGLHPIGDNGQKNASPVLVVDAPASPQIQTSMHRNTFFLKIGI